MHFSPCFAVLIDNDEINRHELFQIFIDADFSADDGLNSTVTERYYLFSEICLFSDYLNSMELELFGPTILLVCSIRNLRLRDYSDYFAFSLFIPLFSEF
jgi:hypothetical protein